MAKSCNSFFLKTKECRRGAEHWGHRGGEFLKLELTRCNRSSAHRRRRATIASGTRSAQASNAAQANPAGVARPVAVTETQLPMFKRTVPFISSGCGAAVGESSAENSAGLASSDTSRSPSWPLI
jgi:hypothetical protein